MTETTRRTFVKTTGAVAAAGMLPAVAFGRSRSTRRPDDELRMGLIGCGGRGTGAINDSMTANYGMRLVAVADLWEGKCHTALKNLSDAHENGIDVPSSNVFTGLDAYKRVIEHPDVDIVVLTTSPGFRALMLDEAVAAKKHVFAEKPTCVDPTQYRACLEAGRQARAQGTAIVTGTQYRRQPSYMEAIREIHNGAIGKVTSAVSYYCSSGIWYRARKPGATDMQYQLDNWYHFVWLSGDQIVEQAVHNLDAINWVMQSPPSEAYGHGGQLTRPEDSEIYDHMSIDYTYPNGANVSFKCRQIPGTDTSVINTITGTKGVAYVNPDGSRIVDHDGNVVFRHVGRGNNPYQQEHLDLATSIRTGNPIVEIEETADSSMTAVLGRMSAYTGKRVTWDFATKSKLDLMPKDLAEDAPAPKLGLRVPGKTPLV